METTMLNNQPHNFRKARQAAFWFAEATESLMRCAR
jgi:hypothetical protein